MKLINQQKIDLKNHPEINEKAVQEYIFENPSVLGLGELQPIIKEKNQPQGGRLDMLFGDEDNNRYEVELQLGATDPSHIIRTIEYWDTERKRYPQYDHTAVIIAEDITSRFQNVISLFNNQIPLIALQIAATLTQDGNVALTFIKVMDKVEPVSEDEEYTEPTDRPYWEKRSSKKMMQLTDSIFESLRELLQEYELKYNKFYVGIARDGVANNFVYFNPKKKFIIMNINAEEDPEISDRFDQRGLDASYTRKTYVLRIGSINEFRDNQEDIVRLVERAKSKREIG